MTGTQPDNIISGTITSGVYENKTGDLISLTETLLENPQDFFSSPGGATILGSIVVFLYIVILFWVIKDSSKRYRGALLPILRTILIAIITPIFGLPLYRALRPIWYKKDRLFRKEALDLTTIKCFKCRAINNNNHKHCIFCGTQLHHTCHNCHKLYPVDNLHCPFCGSGNKAL